MTPHRLTPAYLDWPAVLRLILDAFAFMGGRIDPPSSAHRLTVEDMAAQAETGAVWIIEDNTAPIACLFANPRADALYIGKLAVAVTHRGQGLARRVPLVGILPQAFQADGFQVFWDRPVVLARPLRFLLQNGKKHLRFSQRANRGCRVICSRSVVPSMKSLTM